MIAWGKGFACRYEKESFGLQLYERVSYYTDPPSGQHHMERELAGEERTARRAHHRLRSVELPGWLDGWLAGVPARDADGLLSTNK